MRGRSLGSGVGNVMQTQPSRESCWTPGRAEGGLQDEVFSKVTRSSGSGESRDWEEGHGVGRQTHGGIPAGEVGQQPLGLRAQKHAGRAHKMPQRALALGPTARHHHLGPACFPCTRGPGGQAGPSGSLGPRSGHSTCLSTDTQATQLGTPAPWVVSAQHRHSPSPHHSFRARSSCL